MGHNLRNKQLGELLSLSAYRNPQSIMPPPISDYNNTDYHMDVKYSNHQNPQTPSSIPNIILTADDGSDEELQKVLAMSTNEFDCFSAEDFKEGLGKLDDTMIRLLSDNNPMDQQLADPATE